MSTLPFKDCVGHESVRDILSKMMEQNRIPHAFLFVGPHKIGKTYMANRLIQALLPGQSIKEANPDYVELSCLVDEKTGKKKSNISVEQVRDVCERLSMSALHGGWKIAFIQEANKLSSGAANALLKTLEEPKGKTLIILRAPSIESVLPTIASRCQVMRFHPVAKEVLVKGLVKKGFDEVDARAAASFALGRPGAALRYLTKSGDRSEADIAVAQTIELFQSSIPKQLSLIAKSMPKEDQNKREVADRLLQQWQGVWRDVLLQKIGCSSLLKHEPYALQTNAFAQSFSTHQILQVLQRAEEGRSAISHNTNPHITLEHILFSL